MNKTKTIILFVIVSLLSVSGGLLAGYQYHRRHLQDACTAIQNSLKQERNLVQHIHLIEAGLFDGTSVYQDLDSKARAIVRTSAVNQITELESIEKDVCD